MLSKKEIGEKGEKIALNHLLKKGYTILERNWKHRKKEIDIIAEKGNQIIIIEVKSRSHDCIESPKDAVTKKKQRLIINAADAYINKKDIELEARFDIISILFFEKSYQIEHIEDAFYPIVK